MRRPEKFGMDNDYRLIIIVIIYSILGRQHTLMSPGGNQHPKKNEYIHIDNYKINRLGYSYSLLVVIKMTVNCWIQLYELAIGFNL